MIYDKKDEKNDKITLAVSSPSPPLDALHEILEREREKLTSL